MKGRGKKNLAFAYYFTYPLISHLPFWKQGSVFVTGSRLFIKIRCRDIMFPYMLPRSIYIYLHNICITTPTIHWPFETAVKISLQTVKICNSSPKSVIAWSHFLIYTHTHTWGGVHFLQTTLMHTMTHTHTCVRVHTCYYVQWHHLERLPLQLNLLGFCNAHQKVWVCSLMWKSPPHQVILHRNQQS